MPCCIVIIAIDGGKKHEIYQKTSLEISDRSLVYTTQLRLFLFSQRNRHYNAIKQVFYILIFLLFKYLWENDRNNKTDEKMNRKLD